MRSHPVVRAKLLALLAAAAIVPAMTAAGEPRVDIAELTRLSEGWDEAIMRKDEKAVADRAPYLTNTAPAATKTITAVGPPLTRDRGSPADSRCHPSYLSSDKHEDS